MSKLHAAAVMAFTTSSLALAPMGCNSPNEIQNNASIADDAGQIAVRISNSANIAAVKLNVQRVSCNGESIVPFAIVRQVYFADGTGAVQDVFIRLEPGCYDITAQPFNEEGQPLANCNAGAVEQVRVVDEMTTEIGIFLQCLIEPVGVIDAYVKIDADVAAAKFTLTRVPCENESVEAQFFDKTEVVSNSPWVSALFLVPPGCFDLLIDPFRADGSPSDACKSTAFVGAIVYDGMTTEISTEFMCQ